MINVNDTFKAGEKVWIVHHILPHEITLKRPESKTNIFISLMHDVVEKYKTSGKIIKTITTEENKMIRAVKSKLKTLAEKEREDAV